ncbi:hypothetical protein DSO57_1021560 [Entomophthora muscae]|uniref:Uncharacterized protein n=1 Tax=Entomophthora muscae TaxID=34485 RepID=A0ACC2U1W0_9FUNG|nr:hypothetical protein DSO57_1021560 [Entomophthora muscae]
MNNRNHRKRQNFKGAPHAYADKGNHDFRGFNEESSPFYPRPVKIVFKGKTFTEKFGPKTTFAKLLNFTYSKIDINSPISFCYKSYSGDKRYIENSDDLRRYMENESVSTVVSIVPLASCQTNTAPDMPQKSEATSCSKLFRFQDETPTEAV